MRKFFYLSDDCKRSCIEIQCNIPFEKLQKYFIPCGKEKLPLDTLFDIVKGKKLYDVIFYHEVGTFKFYSEKIINVLSRHIDMSDKCYPITIKNCKKQYYAIYNLDSYLYFNSAYSDFNKDHEVEALLIPTKGLPPIFSAIRLAEKEEVEERRVDFITELGAPVNITRLVLVSSEVKSAMIQKQITNAYFEEWNGYDEDEYAEWKRRHGIIRDY